MAGPIFRLVCTPGTVDGAPEGWVEAMLDEGELALLVDGGGLDAISQVAHSLDLVTVPLLRAALACHTGMATFAQAGVANKE